jgi:hypothetical protein
MTTRMERRQVQLLGLRAPWRTVRLRVSDTSTAQDLRTSFTVNYRNLIPVIMKSLGGRIGEYTLQNL